MDILKTQTSHKNKPHLNQSRRFWIFILFVALILSGIYRFHLFEQQKSIALRGLPVVLAKVTTQNVPVYLYALGNVIPTYSVTIKTQLNGLLMQVLFREGQLVKKGDLLAKIDDRPYQAQLIEYQGQYERDQAQLVNALIDLKRYQTLWKQDSISQQTLATQEALVKQLKGTLKLDLGLIETTKVNLIYTKVIAPIDGRIGLRLVDPGNFVQTSDTTGIAIINTINPITIIFFLAEDNIPDVLRAIKLMKSLPVEALDRKQNKLLATGTLLALDNQIDTTTGTVKLRSQFQNNNNLLFPNQFVNIRLLVKTLKNATVVPTAAIQHSNNMSYVYMVNEDHSVTAKAVTEGVTIADKTTITPAIPAGKEVVVEGADKLINGAKIYDASLQEKVKA